MIECQSRIKCSSVLSISQTVPMQLLTPSVVAMAVRMAMSVIFQPSSSSSLVMYLGSSRMLAFFVTSSRVNRPVLRAFR